MNEIAERIISHLLGNLHIPYQELQPPFYTDHIIALGVLKNILSLQRYDRTIRNFFHTLQTNSVLFFTLEENIHFITMTLTNKNVLFIGPYLTSTPNDQMLLKITLNHEIPDMYNSLLTDYLQQLCLIRNPVIYQAIIHTIACEVYGNEAAFTIQYKDLSLPKSLIPKQILEDCDEKILSYHNAEVKQQLRSRLFRAIYTGDTIAAMTVFNEMLHLPQLPSGLPDDINLRMLWSQTNALLGIAAVEAGVHPYFVQHLSYKKELYIHKDPDLGSCYKDIIQMITDYCKLVRSHSLKGLSPIIQEIINLVRINPSGNYKPAHLADKYKINPSYLSSLFKRETGMTFTENVNQIRVERAARLLCTTNLKVQDIAAIAGINDLNYFIRVFRKYYSVSPNQYRKLNITIK